MSKHNNMNPGQYYDGSRLETDERARERVKQDEQAHAESQPTKDRRRPDRQEQARSGERGEERD